MRSQVASPTDVAILQGIESFFERLVVAQLLMKLPTRIETKLHWLEANHSKAVTLRKLEMFPLSVPQTFTTTEKVSNKHSIC